MPVGEVGGASETRPSRLSGSDGALGPLALDGTLGATGDALFPLHPSISAALIGRTAHSLTRAAHEVFLRRPYGNPRSTLHIMDMVVQSRDRLRALDGNHGRADRSVMGVLVRGFVGWSALPWPPLPGRSSSAHRPASDAPAFFTNAARSFITRRRQVVPFTAAGFDTALRAVLKTSPGLVLSEGPRIGPESKPEGRTIRSFMNSPG